MSGNNDNHDNSSGNLSVAPQAATALAAVAAAAAAAAAASIAPDGSASSDNARTANPPAAEHPSSQPIPANAPASMLHTHEHEQQQALAHEALPPPPPAAFSQNAADAQIHSPHTITHDRPSDQPHTAATGSVHQGQQQHQQDPSANVEASAASSSSSTAPPPLLPQPSQMASMIQSSLHWVYSISTPETFDADGNPRNRRKRRRTTDEEHAALEAAYRLDPQMPPAEREKLARSLSMPPKSVQIWFQNRRQTAKKNQDGTWNGIGKWQRTPYKVVGNYKVVGPEHVATQPPVPPTDPVVDAVHALVSLSQGNNEEGKGSTNGQGEGESGEGEAQGQAHGTSSASPATRGGKRGGRGGRTGRAAGSNKRKSRNDDENESTAAGGLSGQDAAAQPATGASTQKPTAEAAKTNEAIPSLDSILADSAAMDEDENENHTGAATSGDGGASSTEQGVQQLLAATPPLVPLQVSHTMVEELMAASGAHETPGIISPSLLTSGVGATAAHTAAAGKGAGGMHPLHATLGAIPTRLTHHISSNATSSAHASEFFNFSGYAADVEAAGDAAGSGGATNAAAGAGGRPQPSQPSAALPRQ
ncbi:hypothetical protein HDU89_002785 [Geranomyces variabilis]|nr:hypothetical protein HDU89_002785 [Geranomyces variabilis]